MQTPPKASPFKNIPDFGTCLSRFSSHPVLKSEPLIENRFRIVGEMDWARSILATCASHMPYQSAINSPIEVHIQNKPYKKGPTWLGCVEENTISLFSPALENAVTLTFAFCHEYGHWLQKKVAVREDWEGYLEFTNAQTDSGPLNVTKIIEEFCDNFAWFCVSPDFLLIKDSQKYQFFTQWVTKGMV